MKKWILVAFFLLLSIASALVMLSVTGVIAPQQTLIDAGRSIVWLEPHVNAYLAGVQGQQWRAEQEEELSAAWDEVAAAKAELDQEKRAIQDQEHMLQRDRQELEQWRQSLEIEWSELTKEADQQERLMVLAFMYEEMRPREVATILQLTDSDFVEAILLAMNPSHSAAILSELPAEFAAELSDQIINNSM